MIHRLWYWLNGYVILRFRGANLELLLNRLATKGIILWDVERVADDIIIASLSVQSFSNIRPLLWGTRTDVSIVDKRGLPFTLNKLKYRQTLILGMLVVFVAIYYLSGFIWFIQVDGYEDVSQETILQVAAIEGLQIGIAKKKLNLRTVEIALMTKIDKLSWAGVTVRGSLAIVQVAERSTPEQESIQFGNLVAAQDGLITHILPFRGLPQVQVGDTVKKGQLLISGKHYDMYGRLQEGRPEGIVQARVWYEAVGEAAFSRIVQTTAGNTHVNYSIVIGNQSFTFGKQPPFRLHKVDKKTFQPGVRGYKLPLVFSKNLYEEVYYETMVVPEAEARVLALERAWKKLDAMGVEQESVEDFQIEEIIITDQLGIRVGLIVEVQEEIGEFAPKQ